MQYISSDKLSNIVVGEEIHFLDALTTNTPETRRKSRPTLSSNVHPETVKTAIYIKHLFKVHNRFIFIAENEMTTALSLIHKLARAPLLTHNPILFYRKS